MSEYEELRGPLGLTRRLGCGGDGCVYETSRGTIVKMTTNPDEYAAAQYFKRMNAWTENSGLPVLYRVGIERTGHGRFAYIEREALSDLKLDNKEWSALQTLKRSRTALDRFLYWGDALPQGLRPDTVKLVLRMRTIVKKLQASGIAPIDLDKIENWGVDSQGMVKVRDFGQFKRLDDDAPLRGTPTLLSGILNGGRA